MWMWAVALAGLFVTVPLVRTDLAVMRLPNPLTFGLFAWGLLCAATAAIVASSFTLFLTPLLTGVALASALLISGYFAHGGVGLGDVKLVAGTSTVLAIYSWQVALLAVAFAFVLMAIRAVYAITRGHATFTSRLPFGPAILAGAWLAVFVAIASDLRL
jgi:leader peptidase (prepilin peptidase)/N-methyltransferase